MPKATHPDGRMGMYTRLNQVPAHLRLDYLQTALQDRDLWAEWAHDGLGIDDFADSTRADYQAAETKWKRHTAAVGRHHACADPEHVESWLADALEDYATSTVKRRWWWPLEQFYAWMHTHTDLPHSYNPVMMAAATGDAAGQVWAFKVNTAKEDWVVRYD